MTRTIFMEVSCDECGYHGEMDEREWSSKKHCPKCSFGTLQRGATVKQRGTTLDKAMAKQPAPAVVPAAKPAAESPKVSEEPPGIPAAKRYIGSGKIGVEEYVKEGKSLEEIIKLMEGKLQATTVKVYYCYAIKDQKLAPTKQVEQKAEPHEPAKAAATLPVKQYKDMRIINIDVFEDFVNGMRRDLELAPKTESTSGALIVVFQILGMIKTLKRDIYLK